MAASKGADQVNRKEASGAEGFAKGCASGFTSGHSVSISSIMKFLIVVLSLLTSSAAASEVCIEAPYANADGVEQRNLASLFAEVSTALIRFPSHQKTVEARAPLLCASSRMDGAYGYFDVERNRIYIDKDLPNDLKLGVLLHEIRHLHQFELGACPSDDLAMREYALAAFALEADASAISLLMAWDMKEMGDARAWNALSAWPTQLDIAARFAAEMEASGSVEAAASAAFDQWFASEFRRTLYYRSVCSGYLDRQDASKASPRYQQIPTDFYARLCRLPDGTSYGCSVAKFKGH